KAGQKLTPDLAVDHRDLISFDEHAKAPRHACPMRDRYQREQAVKDSHTPEKGVDGHFRSTCGVEQHNQYEQVDDVQSEERDMANGFHAGIPNDRPKQI